MPDSADPPADYSETEQAIFDAALKEFAREGRHGARMQAIADAANINKAMLHYYFGDKDTLYDEVFGYTMQKFMASFSASLKDAPTFEETLRLFIDGYIDFIRSHEACMRLLVHENLAGGTLLGEYVQEAMKSGDAPPKILVETIASAVEAEEIRSVDPDQTVLSVVSTCLYAFVAQPTVQMLHPQADDNWEAFLESRKEHVFDLIYHGLAP